MYVCVEVVIYQSDRFPEMFMISQTPMIGGTSNTSDGSRNVEETLPVFG